jgi:hypothetical protein
MTSQIGIRKSGLRIRIRKNLFPPKWIKSENLGVFLPVLDPDPAFLVSADPDPGISFLWVTLALVNPADQNQSLRAWLAIFTDIVQ